MNHFFSWLLLVALSFTLTYSHAQSSFDAKQKQGTPTLSVDALVPTPIIRHTGFSTQQQTPQPASLAFTQEISLSPAHHTVIVAPETGLPIFIEGEFPALAGRAVSQDAIAEQVAFDFLEQSAPTLGISQARDAFSVLNIDKDDLGMTHVKMQQTHQGLPVYGKEIILHMDGGSQMRMTGRYTQVDPQLNITPTLQSEDAIQHTMTHLSEKTLVQELSPRWTEFYGYTGPETELIIYDVPGYLSTIRLAYHVSVHPNVLEHWEYFVDAHTGEILNFYNHTCTLGHVMGSGVDLNGVNRSLNVFDDNGTYYLINVDVPMFTGNQNNFPSEGDGYILTADMNNTNLNNPTFTYATSNSATSWAPNAVSAHYNAKISYEYFLNTFSRNSINGQGGDVVSFINVADEDGGSMENAFWNGQAMFYGNGGQAFSSLAGALDVGGHEMSHGVIQNTANLEYQGQSGALNESFADIFGVMIDRDDWQLGEDITNTNFIPTGFLRDMSNPNNGGSSLQSPGWQPANMSELYTGSQDNGGVHINSGIVNFAFYKYAIATSREIAERVYYRALTTYLTRSSQFIDGRIAIIQSAKDLYGQNSPEVAAVQNAFAAVGIGDPASSGNNDPTPTNDTPEVPENPGQDFIVSNDVNVFDNNTWYISNTDGQNFQILSQTTPRTRMSVTDDGSRGFFVGTDNHIYFLNMDPNNPQESQLSNNPEWDNVAISKDGTKLAAVSNVIDTSIYIFNLTTNPVSGRQYKLYNPTTSNGGQRIGGVLYADAINWDFSGQYVLYDAFNRLPNPNGADLEYWDVGFLRVWDNSTNDFGDGFISKLFNSLPEGVSVGNAVFSKNSPSIIAFDYFDASANTNAILAGNTETGDVGTVVANNPILGYPDYSKEDDKIIFNSESGFTEYVQVVSLQNDKITGASTPQNLISDGRWGTWYSVGSRDINVSNDEGEVLTPTAVIYPNPAGEQLNIQLSHMQAGNISWEMINPMGQAIQEGQEMLTQANDRLTVDLQDLAAGTYVLKLRQGERQFTETFVKQ
ncbi:MAG: M4 family metallopeptidase [Bacteroidota bacterium]